MLLHMPVVVILLAISSKDSPASAPATEENPIANAENSIDTKMDNMMNILKVSIFMLSRANEPRYCGYQTAWDYTIEADNSPPHTPMNFTPPKLSKWLTCYWLRPNYQQYSRRWLGPWIYREELRHIHMFSPDVRTALEKSLTHLHQCGRLTLEPRGQYRGEISRYCPERGFLSLRAHAWAVAWQGQQGGGVAASAVALCKISAVFKSQCSGDCVLLRDCLAAVGTWWVLLWSDHR